MNSVTKIAEIITNEWGTRINEDTGGPVTPAEENRYLDSLLNAAYASRKLGDELLEKFNAMGVDLDELPTELKRDSDEVSDLLSAWDELEPGVKKLVAVLAKFVDVMERDTTDRAEEIYLKSHPGDY